MKKKNIFFTIAVLFAFCSGFALHSVLQTHTPNLSTGRVTGIGGIFFKSKDPSALRAWYKQHLGITASKFGAVFEWRQAADSTQKGFTQWALFPATTHYFGSTGQDFMINYRVDNLQQLVNTLRQQSITFTDSIETAPYGKFVHLLDGDGNTVELWEPIDTAYDRMGKKMGTTTIF